MIAIKYLALMPRYFEERIDYLNVDGLDSLTFPMTCFCDIPLSKVGLHMENYGHYGIALKKRVCVRRDVQPISYINTKSRLCDDLSEALNKLYNSSNRIATEWEFVPDYILSQILYTKPITGVMRRMGEEPKKRLFQDECEWRYIPSRLGDMPLILPQEYNNDKGLQTYSNALSKQREAWFRFKVEDIEYVIVPNENEANRLISFIRRMKGLQGIHKWKVAEKYALISKIEVSEKFRRNLA